MCVVCVLCVLCVLCVCVVCALLVWRSAGGEGGVHVSERA
eukprot:COSAG02_NODE_37994_length_435_cov_0.497024_2_plen_39_part_01